MIVDKQNGEIRFLRQQLAQRKVMDNLILKLAQKQTEIDGLK